MQGLFVSCGDVLLAREQSTVNRRTHYHEEVWNFLCLARKKRFAPARQRAWEFFRKEEAKFICSGLIQTLINVCFLKFLSVVQLPTHFTFYSINALILEQVQRLLYWSLRVTSLYVEISVSSMLPCGVTVNLQPIKRSACIKVHGWQSSDSVNVRGLKLLMAATPAISHKFFAIEACSSENLAKGCIQFLLASPTIHPATEHWAQLTSILVPLYCSGVWRHHLVTACCEAFATPVTFS